MKQVTISPRLEMEHMIPDVPLISLPVPLYLPSPTPSYRLFKPRAVPIPVPFFVPIMIPVPRKAFKNIRDYLQVKKKQDPCKYILFFQSINIISESARSST